MLEKQILLSLATNVPATISQYYPIGSGVTNTKSSQTALLEVTGGGGDDDERGSGRINI